MSVSAHIIQINTANYSAVFRKYPHTHLLNLKGTGSGFCYYLQRIRQVALVYLLASSQLHEHPVLPLDGSFSFSLRLLQIHVIKCKTYIPGNLDQQIFFRLVNSDIACKQHNKQPEKPHPVLDPDNRNISAKAYVFENAISAPPGFIHDCKTILVIKYRFYALRMITCHQILTKTGDILAETGTHDIAEALVILHKSEPDSVVAPCLCQEVGCLLQESVPLFFHYDQLIDIPDGLEHAVEMFNLFFHLLALDGIAHGPCQQLAIQSVLAKIVLGALLHRANGKRCIVEAGQYHDRHIRRPGIYLEKGLQP